MLVAPGSQDKNDVSKRWACLLHQHGSLEVGWVEDSVMKLIRDSQSTQQEILLDSGIPSGAQARVVQEWLTSIGEQERPQTSAEWRLRHVYQKVKPEKIAGVNRILDNYFDTWEQVYE